MVGADAIASVRAVSVSCKKEVFEALGKDGTKSARWIHYLVRERSGGEKLEMALFFGPAASKPAPTRECLRDGLATLRELDSPGLDRLVDLRRSSDNGLWDDPDLGPAKWLHCGERNTPAWGGGVATLAHEMAHELTGPDCLRLADGKETCFVIPPELPPRAFGFFEVASVVSIPAQREAMGIPLEIYGRRIEGSIVLLLDEVLAYAFGTEVLARFLSQGKKSLVLDASNGRSPTNLPSMLAMTANYFARLREERPEEFERLFRKNPELRGAVRFIRERAHDVRALYAAGLAKHGKKEALAETELYAWAEARFVVAGMGAVPSTDPLR